MSQILPDEAASAPEDPLDPEAPAFGKALSERPPLESSHATLTRTHWVRRTIEQALQGRTVKAEVQADGRLALVLDEPLSRDILQYDLSPKSEYDRFELFSLDNGKMRCPTWDLVAGPPSVGGTCPAASAGQTICEPNIRRTMLTEAKSAAPRGADRQPVAKGQLILTERMPTKDGKMVPVPFWEGDEPAPNQFRTPICQYCVTGDTRVLVRGRGLVPIADLVGAGDFEVWSGRAWQKTHAEMTGVRPTVTVRTNWGLSVRCTDNHLVKVAVGFVPEFVPAGVLCEGERLDVAHPAEESPAEWRAPEGAQALKVVSVQRNDVLEPVYDLFDVGPEHQFVANGLTVHNCYASAGNYRGMNVAVGGIVRYHWTKKLIEQDPELWVRTIVTAFKQLPYPQEGAGANLIMPARVHSTGDFFSPAYAQAWIQVANALHAWDPRIILWAPTRSWATPYWADTRENGQSHWQRLLDPDNLVSARRGKKLNFVVRASAYHVGDEAPGKLHPTNAVGTTSIFVPDNQTTEKKTDPRYDVDCPVYDRARDAKSCRWAFDPVTGELGCRVCWRNKDIRVNFTTH